MLDFQLLDLITNCLNAITFFARKRRTLPCFELFLLKLPVITEILNTLRIPFEVTKAVQNASFTLSDFYGSWLRMERKLKTIIEAPNALTNFAQTLMEKIAERKSSLLNNQALLCAVYLDPRYKHRLTSDEVSIAKIALEMLYLRAKKAQELTVQTDSSANVKEDSFENECVGSGMQRVFPRSNKQKKATVASIDRADIGDAFAAYENVDRCHHEDSILEFWFATKDEHPVIYVLACIIFAIPPTQATVERAFSALGYIYNPLRTKLSERMLEDILMIYLNKELYEPMTAREMEALTTAPDNVLKM